jgi:hypothetical protein
MGRKRDVVCEHRNVFKKPGDTRQPRKPLRQVSEKRQAEEDSGARPQRRGSTMKRGRGFECTPAQREKVKGLPCVNCGHGEDFDLDTTSDFRVDPAHLWPRGKGGCDDPLCVIPLCRTCHQLFDEGRLELLPKLIDKGYWVEMAHPISEHEVSPFTLTERLTFDPSPTTKGIATAAPDLPLSIPNERSSNAATR